MDNNMIYNPAHYNHAGRRECWEEMIEIFGEPAVAIFDVLSAYKYHYRAGTKADNPEEQDKAKIDNYMQHANGMLYSCKCSLSDAESAYRRFDAILKSGFNPYQE